MNPNFQRFTRGMKRMPEPILAIQKDRGNATINEAAWDALGRPERIYLLFDEEHQILGIEAAEPGATDSYPVRAIHRGQTSRTFSVSALLNYYGVKVPETRRYKPQVIGDRILAVNLREPLPETVRRGPHKQEKIA